MASGKGDNRILLKKCLAKRSFQELREKGVKEACRSIIPRCSFTGRDRARYGLHSGRNKETPKPGYGTCTTS